jgi:hypothetical protein
MYSSSAITNSSWSENILAVATAGDRGDDAGGNNVTIHGGGAPAVEGSGGSANSDEEASDIESAESLASEEDTEARLSDGSHMSWAPRAAPAHAPSWSGLAPAAAPPGSLYPRWASPFETQPAMAPMGGGGGYAWRDGGNVGAVAQSWSGSGGSQVRLSSSLLGAGGGGGQGWTSTRRECLPHVLEGQDRYICDEQERMICLGESGGRGAKSINQSQTAVFLLPVWYQSLKICKSVQQKT